MYRDFFANKWIFGGIAFLIVFGIACVLWYHYDTAPDKRDTAEAERIAQQWQNAKKTNSHNLTKDKTDTPAEFTLQTAEKPKTEIIDSVSMENDVDVRVSPYGFGRYPEVPEDYPTPVAWEMDQTYLPESLRPQSELLSRVLVKLWSDGDKNFWGGSTHNGKVYPHYYNTVYVRFAEYINEEGKTVRYPARGKSGPHVSYTQEELLDPPSHLRVIDLDSSGIDPYQFLNIQ